MNDYEDIDPALIEAMRSHFEHMAPPETLPISAIRHADIQNGNPIGLAGVNLDGLQLMAKGMGPNTAASLGYMLNLPEGIQARLNVDRAANDTNVRMGGLNLMVPASDRQRFIAGVNAHNAYGNRDVDGGFLGYEQNLGRGMLGAGVFTPKHGEKHWNLNYRLPL